jgi:hypothetical protein
VVKVDCSQKLYDWPAESRLCLQYSVIAGEACWIILMCLLPSCPQQDPSYWRTVHLGGAGRQKEEAERKVAEKVSQRGVEGVSWMYGR